MFEIIDRRLKRLDAEIDDAPSTAKRKELAKERTSLERKLEELRDLDDGVRANYGKFCDLLAGAKAVTGGKEDRRRFSSSTWRRRARRRPATACIRGRRTTAPSVVVPVRHRSPGGGLRRSAAGLFHPDLHERTEGRRNSINEYRMTELNHSGFRNAAGADLMRIVMLCPGEKRDILFPGFNLSSDILNETMSWTDSRRIS